MRRAAFHAVQLSRAPGGWLTAVSAAAWSASNTAGHAVLQQASLAEACSTLHGSYHFTSLLAVARKDYYEVLEVQRGASDGDIKKAYYKLAKTYHPDTNQGDPGAAKKFQEVQKAYDTLRDPQKRQAYDRLGHASYERMEAGGGTPGADGAGPFPGGEQVDPEDLLREFFGGRQGFQGTIFDMFGGGVGGGFRTRPMRGQTLRTALTISFDEAVHGAKKTIDLSALGLRGVSTKPVEIDIPAGVDTGFTLQVAGCGLPGPQGTAPGDLLVQVRVLPSPTFERDEFDLYVDVPVDMADAALGTTIEVPTISGRSEVKVKPGTQPNDKLRMRGYGVPMAVLGDASKRGDQYVVIKVNVPKTLTDKQRQLLEEFKEEKQQPKKKGWFS